MKSIIYLGFALLLLTTAGLISKASPKPSIQINQQDSRLNVHHNLLPLVSIGNKRLISDMVWITTLLESDDAHYSGKDYNSWMYLRFLSIAYLDPEFYQNYLYGGIYLSVVKDDPIGGSDILKRGLQKFPDDYDLNYYLGFNYLYEFEENAESLKYLEKIKDHPRAQGFLALLVNKLRYVTSGNYEVTMAFLRDAYNSNAADFIKSKLRSDIYALKAEYDLNCLNSGKDKCAQTDENGDSYIYKDGKWTAAKEFIVYKINRKPKKN